MALLCGREKQTTTWGHGAQGLQGDPQARPANQRALQAQSGASPGAPPARPPARPGSAHGLFPHAPGRLQAQPGRGLNG